MDAPDYCGLDEALHVFIEGNQLIERWQVLDPECPHHFVIAEVGFSAGRNFLLTWILWKQYAPASASLHFISCEQNPLSQQDLSTCLALWPELHEQATQLLASYPILTPGFHLLQFEKDRVSLTLMLGNALDCYREHLICGDVSLESDLRESYVDAWFLGDINPQQWNESLFVTMGMLSKRHTTLAALTAAGVVREGLDAIGFKVCEYGPNKDRLIAEFDYLSPRHTKRYTPWHVGSPKAVKVKKALVLGAGLAGCFTANALARRGWSVTILDAHAEPGCGASGNQQAILFPQFSPGSSPLTRFMLASYLYAIQAYKKLLSLGHVGEFTGLLQLAHNLKESIFQANLQSWLTQYPELAMSVSAAEASELAGISLQSGGLFIPNSGWFNSPVLCKLLLQQQDIQLRPNTHVNSITYDGMEWNANDCHAEVLVIANGYRANEFIETDYLPITAVQGQMTLMLSNEPSVRLKIPLCANGHIAPAYGGVHNLGATYHSGVDNGACQDVDDQQNIAILNRLSTVDVWSRQVIDHWAGVRAVTPDYLPLVGPVANAKAFKQQFASLASDSQRWIPLPGIYYDGLFACAGFGSRGLTTIPLSGEWLASMINKEPSSLPRSMIQTLSPARFLRKAIFRVT